MTRAHRVLILLLLAAMAVPAFAQQAQPEPQKPEWKQIPTPPLPPFHPQEPRRIQLKNGLVMFLQEDHELPLIDGVMRVRGGGRDIPVGKTGMMAILGEAWRTGGTKSKTGDELDDFLEARAAKVETGGSVDSTTISFSSLKADFDDVFAAFLELLHNPEFRQDKIELAKEQVNTSISRRNDELGSIASRESTKLAYGPENPWARQAEYATVAAVTRQDLLDFHKRYVQPNNIILGIVGDFDSKAMEAKLRKAFEGWPRGLAFQQTPAQFIGAKPGLYFIPKEDVNQTAIRMVYPVEVTRRSPDYFPIEVMNQVLSGGFASRLMTNVRSKAGLAYAVGGGIGVPYDHPGIFRLVVGTKSQSTVDAIEALRKELVDMIQNPPRADELKRAKDEILNAFIFNFDSKEKVLRERMAYEFYGYPPDFLEQYRRAIEKVTEADVARVANKYLHSERVAVLAVGNDKEFGKPLASLGPVTPIDITIPPPAGEAGASAPSETAAPKAAPAASNAEGKALAAKVVEGMGGEAKLQTLKAYRKSGEMKDAPGMGDVQFTRITVLPDRQRTTMESGMGSISAVVTPEAAFMAAGGEARDLPASQREDLVNNMKRDSINVAQHLNDPKYIFAAGETEKIGETEVRVLDVVADGARTRWYVDPRTGHILRAEFDRMSGRGPIHRVEDYAAFRPVEGITVPFESKISDGGQDAGTSHLTEFVVNPEVDPKLFEKPTAPK